MSVNISFSGMVQLGGHFRLMAWVSFSIGCCVLAGWQYVEDAKAAHLGMWHQ